VSILQAVEKRDLRCYASSFVTATYSMYVSFLRIRAPCISSFFNNLYRTFSRDCFRTLTNRPSRPRGKGFLGVDLGDKVVFYPHRSLKAPSPSVTDPEPAEGGEGRDEGHRRLRNPPRRCSLGTAERRDRNRRGHGAPCPYNDSLISAMAALDTRLG